MNILIENGCYDHQNMGDVAMLQVAVERLQQLWPQATIQVITSRPDLLARYCPTTQAISATGRSEWFCDRNLFGKIHDLVPVPVKRGLTRLTGSLRRRRPEIMHSVLSLKSRVRRRGTPDMDNFVKALRNADLLAVSGGGDINDEFTDYALTLLEVLETASRKGTPTAMFGQGIGPINTPALRKRAQAVLPSVGLIGVREKLASPSLLESMNVPAERIGVSGDDAIELAYKNRDQGQGVAIGVSIRVSSYSPIDRRCVQDLRDVLHNLSRRHKTLLLPVPISFYSHESDMEALRPLLDGEHYLPESMGHLDDPLCVINAIKGCRIVITGCYHAAVFALSQGIPVVGLAKSEYYRSKFLGLMDQFGTECDVVFFDDDRFCEILTQAADKAWESAASMRPGLLLAAQRQIKSGRSVYEQALRLVEARN